MTKILNITFLIVLIAVCAFIISLFVELGLYILFDTDIPFWVDYWVTNGGA